MSCRVIFGPMFSGKTTEMCKSLTEMADIGFKVLLINHSFDDRDVGPISTHNSTYTSLSRRVSYTKSRDLDIDVSSFDVIGIDEGQFFGERILVVREWVMAGKRVIISSLDGDFRMNNFGNVHELISICDPGGVVKLGAKCKKCLELGRLEDAGFTFRQVDGGDLIEIGGSDKYIPLCLKCHINSTKPHHENC